MHAGVWNGLLGRLELRVLISQLSMRPIRAGGVLDEARLYRACSLQPVAVRKIAGVRMKLKQCWE